MENQVIHSVMLEQTWHKYKSTRFDRFVNAVQDKGLVVFAGAGVSVAPPSSCPTWDILKQEIFSLQTDFR